MLCRQGELYFGFLLHQGPSRGLAQSVNDSAMAATLITAGDVRVGGGWEGSQPWWVSRDGAFSGSQPQKPIFLPIPQHPSVQLRSSYS